VAVDVLDMAPIPGVTFVRGDFTEERVLRRLEEALAGRPVDLVLSDLSPNLSGVAATDQARAIELAELAIAFALAHLKPGGALLLKAFQGSGFPELLRRLRAGFERVVARKPEASRSRSREMYLLARAPRRLPC
jgi:23S rRNA (uridine2552-2'-O)-methyltransferase